MYCTQHKCATVMLPLSSRPFQDVDRWSFDVFALNSASSDHALRTLFFELIIRYELNSRFKVLSPTLRQTTAYNSYHWYHIQVVFFSYLETQVIYYVMLSTDSHFLPDRVPVCTGERILQTQQPLSQPCSCCWCDSDAALPAAAVRTCGTLHSLEEFYW